MIAQLDQKDFEQKVLQADKVAVVEIWGRRCPFCEKLDPIYKELGRQYGSDAYFYQLLAEENPKIIRKYKILGVPTILIFSHGILVDKMRGFQTAQKIKQRVDKYMNYTPEQAQKNAHKNLIKRIFRRK